MQKLNQDRNLLGKDNHREIEAEFARLAGVASNWSPAQRRQSVIDTFCFRWSMTADEVTEIIDEAMNRKVEVETSMKKVNINRGTPDLRRAQPLSGKTGMAVSVRFSVPKAIQGQGESAAIAYVETQLAKACAAAPDLAFHVTFGEPDL